MLVRVLAQKPHRAVAAAAFTPCLTACSLTASRAVRSQNPDDFIPTGTNERYRKNLTELFCGCHGIERIDAEQMRRFPVLETMWLNGNRISKLKGLEHNFRLKHLFLHDNCIATVKDASCCLPELRHLETLQLANNQLQDLKATLAVLSQLPFLKTLQLHGNPLASEGQYREAVIFAIPSLEQLDSSLVSAVERQAAVKLFTAKRIEKKYAFMTVPKIWDKPAKVEIGEASVGELQLRREIVASTRRRAENAEMQRVVRERLAQKPSFELTFAKAPSALLSAKHGAPHLADAPFEFVARGRVPRLLLRLGRLSLTAAAAQEAYSYGGAPSEAVSVHVCATCMGLLPAPLLSRDVLPKDLVRDGGGAAPSALLRFEEFLFEAPGVYARAYDKVLQLLQMGKLEQVCVTLALRESSSLHTIGTARLPLAALMTEHKEAAYAFDGVAFYAGRGGGGGEPLATLSASVLTDWGLSNTSGKAYHNSAFEFVKARKPPPGADPSSLPKPPGAHMARDVFTLSVSSAAAAEGGGVAEAEIAAAAGGAFSFDATRYVAYEKAKAALLPSTHTTLSVPL